MFWICLMNGAAGHTYGANGIWQCNRPGDPHGVSPHGGSYGKIPWNEAMHLPGSRQVGLGKAFLEQYPWHRFEPHPEWVVARQEPLLSLDGCTWIWFPEGNPAKDAPAQHRYFRRIFVLPETNVIERACLRVSADDWCTVELNGQRLGTCDDWRYGRQFDGLGGLLRKDTNVLAIVAENKPTSLPANPAGLLACLEVRFSGGESARFVTDAAWRCATNDMNGWNTAAFDGHTWARPMEIGHHGDGPWGKLAQPNHAASEPQSAGIPGKVRIIYVPEREVIEVRRLEPHLSYEATSFNPVSGETAPLGEVQADSQGMWNCAPPFGRDQDWVLVLEEEKTRASNSDRPK
jgi:uncharacterized protein DUF4038